MKVVTIKEPEKLEIVEAKKPAIKPYQALVKTEKVAICNATDGKLLSGHFPGVEKYPLVLGHEGCGIVEAIGEQSPELSNWRPCYRRPEFRFLRYRL